MQTNFNPFKIKTGDPAHDAHLKRQFIRSFPFPHKMWVIINAGNYDFMRWNRDGTAILLNFVGLKDYLNCPRSIFNMKSSAEFLKHLEEFEFERLDAVPEAGNDFIVQYKHEDFQRHRFDLLGKVRRRTDQASGETSEKDKSCEVNAGEAAEQLLSRIKAKRMQGDPCCMKFGTLSKAEKSRIELETTLKFENAKRKLQEHLNSRNQNTAGQIQQRRGVAQTLAIDESFADLPSEMFENPLDSVFQWSEESGPDYAGYYGNCSEEQVKKFFGDNIPQKEENLSAHNTDMHFKQEQLLFSGDGPYTLTLPPLMLTPRQQTSPNVNLRDYAGPYGNCTSSEERIKKFFVDLLPQKQEGLSAHNSGMHMKQEETSQKKLFSGDSDTAPTRPPVMLSPLQQTSPNFNFPLKLEPILKSAEEADTDYANNVHGDTQASGGDVEIDEYTELKPFDENDNDADHVNADLPIKPSMEQEPDPENEAFTSYLDGLNVLFEYDHK